MGDGYFTLAELQKNTNPDYYKRKGASIYSDFSTHAKRDSLLAGACANYIQSACRKKTIRIGEIGVGDGRFCIDFLNAIQLEGRGILPDYFAFDISERLLMELEKKNRNMGFDIKTNVFDASGGGGIGESLDFCILNELVTDLPTEMVCRKGERMYEVLFTKDLKKTRLALSERMELLDIPEGYFVPVNAACVRLIGSVMKRCREVLVFDYGFDSFYLPPEIWNLNAAREYGGQVTTDLNLIFVKRELEKSGFCVKIEPQAEFISKYSGKTKTKKKGKSEVIEDDYFYHMEIIHGKTRN